MEIKEWLIDWFCNHSSLSAAELEAASKEDYLKKGIIDSFSFVMLIGLAIIKSLFRYCTPQK